MAWTNLTFAFGSLLTSSKMTQLDDNLDSLMAKDGGAPVLANGYVVEAMYGASSVNQTALKTTTASQNQSVSGSGTYEFVLTGGEYSWWFLGGDTTIADFFVVSHPSSYASNVAVQNNIGSSRTAYLYSRYIQSSPPYMIGNIEWGHFLYLLRNISTGEIVGSYEAEDPLWAYNGKVWLPKDDVERIRAFPHPFTQYYDSDPEVDGMEIILVDMKEYDVKQWKLDSRKAGKGILEDLSGKIAPRGIITPASIGLSEIIGFTDIVKIMNRI